MVEAEVERALSLYRRHLTKDQLAGLESMVRDTLQNDPTAVELLGAARARDGTAGGRLRGTPGDGRPVGNPGGGRAARGRLRKRRPRGDAWGGYG